MVRSVYLSFVALLAACVSRDPSPPAVVIDTLPNGVVSVRNYAPSAWRDSSTWHFEEVTRLEPRDSGSEALVNPGAAAVIDEAGRIYVADEDPAKIKVFDSTGQFVRTIGRDGEGPGEYRAPFLAPMGNELVVQDPQLRRVTVYDSSGQVLSTFRSGCCIWGQESVSVDDSGHVWIRTAAAGNRDAAVTFLRFDPAGRLLDTLELPPTQAPDYWVVSRGAGTASYKIPWGADELIAVSPNGGIVRGWSSRYSVALETGVGDTVRIFDRAWAPLPIPQAERVKRFNDFSGMVAKYLGTDIVSQNFHLRDVPTAQPPMRKLDADPSGRIWVETASADTSATWYDVFDASGIWQGTVRAPWPRSADVVWRGTDRVLVREPDNEGLAAFVVYRLVEG